jgi:hypothetical protein
MSLTDAERTLLNIIRNGRTPIGCPCLPDWTQAVADDIRQRVPEVDDTTLARVVLAAASRINAFTVSHGLRTAMRAGVVLTGAAIELAAFDLDHPT